jgi:hypothetical protein
MQAAMLSCGGREEVRNKRQATHFKQRLLFVEVMLRYCDFCCSVLSYNKLDSFSGPVDTLLFTQKTWFRLVDRCFSTIFVIHTFGFQTNSRQVSCGVLFMYVSNQRVFHFRDMSNWFAL